MTAHDVRSLTCCLFCGQLADKRNLVKMPRAGHAHGACFIERRGLPALLALPTEETDKLTLGDIGGDVMAAILKARA